MTFPSTLRAPSARPSSSTTAGLFESTAACSALLHWAGLREVQAVDYQALRERDIERLADLVERHLDTGRLLALCGEPHA